MAKQLTTKQVLQRARKLIEKGWTIRVMARNKYGHPVRYDNPNACKFCVLGALAKTDTHGGYHEARNILANLTGGIVTFNDTHSKQEVLDLFSRAIASCK